MSQRVEVSPIGLLNRYHCDFPPLISFKKDQIGGTINGQSSNNFTTSRVQLLDNFILKGRAKTDLPQALLAEELVGIAIKNPLKERSVKYPFC